MALHEPFSLPSKETHFQSQAPESSTSPHSQPLSPNILTPEITGPGQAHALDEGWTFTKQPIHKPSSYSLGLGSPPTSTTGTDSEAGFGEDGTMSDGNRQPVSLLTALLHSQDQSKNIPAKRPPPPSSTGITSAKSSLPSTAFSSPTGPQHGILQNPPPHPVLTPRPSESEQPTSILRRGSVTSSDGGEFLGLGLGGITGFSTLHHSEKRPEQRPDRKLDPVEEKREKIEWADKQPDAGPSVQRAPSTSRTCALKFAVAQPSLSTQSSDSGDAAVARRASAKQGVTSGTESPAKRPSSPFAKERVVQRHISEDDQEASDADAAEEDEEAETSDASEEVALPGYKRNSAAIAPAPMEVSDSESDAGYQEDEEDGAFSDEEEVAGIFSAAPSAQFPFARPTNYRRKRKGDRLASPSPPPAPAVVSPPVRRGRGHIRVDETAAPTETKKGCSRHCSPPPARSRTGSTSGISRAPPAASSPSARKLSLKRESRRPSHELGMTSVNDASEKDRKDRSVSPRRSSEAGPREGRAGSPMPERIMRSDESDTEDDDDEAEEDVDDVSPTGSVPPPSAPAHRDRGGWRSDHSVFYGSKAQRAREVLPLRVDTFNRNTSAPPARAVFESDAEEVPASAAMEQSASMGDGVRNFFRRASEHLPMFRRPSNPGPPSAISDDVFVDLRGDSPVKRESAPMSTPMPSRPTCTGCPPALDNTPAQAFSSTMRSSQDLDLTSRLEQTLSSQPGAALTRATSTPGKVKFNTGLAAIPPRIDTKVKEDAKRPSIVSSSSGEVYVGPAEPELRSERVKPIACPASSCAKDAAALGWTDEALRKIRRNAGKVE